MTTIEEIDAMIALPAFAPYHGWHDQHRDKDGTPEYLPALQQVRAEFARFVDEIEHHLPLRKQGRVLQLGLGNCDASHQVWRHLFGNAATIDRGRCLAGLQTMDGADTHSDAAYNFAVMLGHYDLLFIDAGHTYDDVAKDYSAYVTLVRPGGIVAFHDSLPRERYPEVEVWRFIKESSLPMSHIGEEVGISWLRKP
jgi:hypothetical protein